MLSMMRDAVGGWIAKILLLLLVASFAVWGVQSSIFGGPGNSVITVGETDVGLLDYRLAYDRQVNEVSRQLGTTLSRDQARNLGVEQSVLANLVSGAVLDENARKMGLGISNDKLAGLIGNDEAFYDASGNFSRSQLRFALQQIGMSEEAYVENRKAVAVRNQIIEGTAAGVALPDTFFEILSQSQSEKRIFNYVLIKAEDVAELPEPDDAELKAFYDANPDNYQAPEYRKVNIVKLEAGDIADESKVTDEEIAAEYEATKDSFTTQGKRRIQQLVFSSAEKAQQAFEKIRDGASFETIMSEEGKSTADIDLGLLAKSEIPDNNIADAAFSLELNETSEVIEGLFGPVLLQVTEIQPEQVKSLEEASDELRKSIALRVAAEEIFETHDKLEDERAAGEPLDAAAKNAGLALREVPAIDRSGRDKEGNIVTGLPEAQKLLQDIFNTDEGIEADPVSIGSDGFVWYEVTGVEDERLKSFEEVAEQVKKDWQQNAVDEAMQKLAVSIKEKVDSGVSLEVASGELLPAMQGEAGNGATEDNANTGESQQAETGSGGDTAGASQNPVDPVSRVKKSAALLRTDTSRDLGKAAVEAGFDNKKGAVVVADAAENAGKVVLQIAEIQEGKKDMVESRTKERLNETLANDILSGLVTELQQKQDVVINQAAINAALSY